MHYVISSVGEGYPDPPFKDTVEAVTALENGRAIRWEPGYGGGYDLLLVTRVPVHHTKEGAVQRWLLDVTTPSATCAIALHEDDWTGAKWARDSTKTPGCWADMKPLLVAFGAAKQFGSISHARDAAEEADARAHNYGNGERLNRSDALLGRKVRRLVEADLTVSNPVQQVP